MPFFQGVPDSSAKIANSRASTKVHSTYPCRNPQKVRLAVAIKVSHIDQCNLNDWTTEAG